MSISVINAAAAYEAPKQTAEKVAKTGPVVQAETNVPVIETQPVVQSNGSEAGNSGTEQDREKEKNLSMV